MDKYTAIYILKNDLGGISSLIKNLVIYRGINALPQAIIFLQVDGSSSAILTDEFVKEVSDRYIELYQKISGKPFERANTSEITSRIEENVARAILPLIAGI